MALTKCPECRSPVSDSAPSCPHCGFTLAPTLPAPPAPQPTAARGVSGSQMLVGAAGLLVLIGSFLPWVTATAPFIGTVSKAGTSGDGIITLIAGGVVMVAAFARWRILAGLGSVVAGVVAVIDLVDINRSLGDIESDLIVASAGVGIWMVVAGAVLGLAGVIRGRDL